MPYIQIRSFPKDEEIKKKVAQKIEEVFLEEWGCRQQAITISFEEVKPENWENDVMNAIVEPNKDNVYVLKGETIK